MKRFLIGLICLTPLLASCVIFWDTFTPITQMPAPTVATGDAGRGEILFSDMGGGVVSCIACHAVQTGGLFRPGRTIGPTLADISQQASERIANLSAEEYIRQSILDPGSYVVEGYENLMFANYGQFLSEEDLLDLIAYLFSL